MSLPQSIVELGEVIGLHNALIMVDAIGGTQISIPLEAKRSSSVVLQRIQSLIGEDAFAELVYHYAGIRMTVARCAKARRVARNGLIVSAYDAGQSVKSLAIAHELTERQIRTILKRSWDLIELPVLSIEAPGENSE